LGFAGVGFAATLAAQAAEPESHPCDAQTGSTKSVCRAAYDAITVIAPIGALAVSRGNPALGTATGGQRFGNLVITFRGTYLKAAFPVTDYDGSTDTVALAERSSFLVPSIDLRLTLLRKTLPVGAAWAELMGTMIGIPREATDVVQFGDDVRAIGGVALGFGYGLRFGVEPNGALPAVSLSVGRSDLPRFSTGDFTSGSNFGYSLSTSAYNVRLMVGRQFGGFELTGGGGVDLIKGDYSLRFRDQVTQAVVARTDSTLSTMRILTVINAGWHLGRIVRLGLEGGFQIGKNDKLATLFEGTNTKSGRFFGGVGLGFKL
jgi:hypothetical protein